MSPHVPESRKKLDYPLYAADFDPLNPDFLLVGGGGGSSSTGVPNKISLINVSRQYESAEITDIELAKDEDSVTTLAVASSSDTALTAIAGINSSLADQNAGENQHLRSFRIGLPARKRKADGQEDEKQTQRMIQTQALGKTALFTSAHGPRNETYQRVLRASPIKSSNEPRITAIASGLAPENEIIAFQPVSNALTSTVDEISRIKLGKNEAADVDLMSIKGNGHTLAYCTEDAVYLQQLPNTKGSKIESAVKLYQCPRSTESTPPSQRPKFRALRLLTPRHILLLQNQPGRSGASLLILKINATNTGHVTLTKRLHKTIKLATGLDTCVIDESPSGEKQIIIAVASQDSSIELVTIDYDPSTGLKQFRPYTLLRDVHSGPLTRLVFSNFIPPTPKQKETTPTPQRVRLASVGLDQIVVCHTLPLRSYPSSSKTSRYVLVAPGRSEALQTTISMFTALLVVVLAALFMQSFCEIRGVVPPTLGVADYLPSAIRDTIARPYPFSQPQDAIPEAFYSAISAIQSAPSHIPVPDIPSASDLKDNLVDLISSNSELETPKAIVVRDTGSDLSTELHHDVELIKDETVKKWEELTHEQKKGWKERLMATGHWVEQQGENVLKGILFSELAGVVGDAVRG